MKFSLANLTLLLTLLFSSAACDSQKTNSTAAPMADKPAMTKGNAEPVAGVTIEELSANYTEYLPRRWLLLVYRGFL